MRRRPADQHHAQGKHADEEQADGGVARQPGAALDETDACATHGPDVQPTIDRLIELGGSREALPDQDAAYQAEQARQASWDAAPTPRKTKTK